MLFTKRFQEALSSTSLSQVEIATSVGISKQCISDFKSGKSFPSIHTLYLICECLDVSSDYLLGLSDY